MVKRDECAKFHDLRFAVGVLAFDVKLGVDVFGIIETYLTS
jgi:hypothetical protein